jgi:drug/metabolite transporter (DMT)-like permease
LLNIPLKAVLISVLIHTLWGGNPIAGKFGLVVFPPFASAFIRFVIGVIVVGLWARYAKMRIWPEPHEWRPLIIIGLMFTLQIGLMNIGIDNTTGIIAAVLISTNPLFAALFAHYLIAGDQLTMNRIIGLLVAFAGVCLTMINPTDLTATDWFTLGIGASVASAMLLGLRLVLSANALKQIEPGRVAIWQMLISLPIYAVASWQFETIRWQLFNWPAVWGLLYQGVVVAGLGFVVSLWLMQRYQPGIMMSFNFVSPVAGVLLAGWLLGEAITSNVLYGVALVAIGLYLIAVKKRRALQADTPA